MDDICYDSSKMVFLWIVPIIFLFIKKLDAEKKTEIKDGLQYTNKKLTLPRNIIIYTSENLEINELEW